MPIDLKEIMEKAQQVQKEMEKAKKELSNKHVDGVSGGGSVTITMNGDYETLKVKIDKDVLKDAVAKDKVALIEDLVHVAYRNAHQQIDAISKEALAGATERLKISEEVNNLPE